MSVLAKYSQEVGMKRFQNLKDYLYLLFSSSSSCLSLGSIRAYIPRRNNREVAGNMLSFGPKVAVELLVK